MKILILQHTPLDPPGVYADLLVQRGGEITVVELDAGEEIPRLSGFDGLIAMGGPMSADDDARYPWLTTEKATIREAVEAGMPFWGACLGAQLLASSMGARVSRMAQPEIGFVPIDFNEAVLADHVFQGIATPFAAFQWHNDAFELPRGAVLLGGSKACANQVFRYGKGAYGVQFHLEATAEIVGRWTELPASRAALEQTLGEGASERLLGELHRHESTQRSNARYLMTRWLNHI